MKNYIDLHMHSSHSDDGDFSPSELMEMCYNAGVLVASITDHNSTKANKEAEEKACKLGITYIAGIEIDCSYKDINLHLLGYGIDYNHEDFDALEKNIILKEQQVSMEKIAQINKLGFSLSHLDFEYFQQYKENGIITGEMVGEVLLNCKKYDNCELLLPYRDNGSRSDNPFVNFYWDFYAKGKPCYVEVTYPSLKETIGLINRHGGTAVLAHPGKTLEGRFDLFDEMVAVGIQGVEASSSYHTALDTQFFYKKGIQHGLLITSGSDFHGKTKPSIQLGDNLKK